MKIQKEITYFMKNLHLKFKFCYFINLIIVGFPEKINKILRVSTDRDGSQCLFYQCYN
jgi:hypothetical protein